jgi:transcriptional regulator with XRE-family HTH domain
MIAEQLRHLLEGRHMTQVELARRLGVTHSAVTMMINNKMLIPIARLEKVLKILRTTSRQRRYMRALYIASIVPESLRDEAMKMVSVYVCYMVLDDVGLVRGNHETFISSSP